MPTFCSGMSLAIKLIHTFLCSEHVDNNSLGARDREKLHKQIDQGEFGGLLWSNTTPILIVCACILNLVDSINHPIFFHEIWCLEKCYRWIQLLVVVPGYSTMFSLHCNNTYQFKDFKYGRFGGLSKITMALFNS